MNYGVVWRRGALENVAAFGDESIFDCIDVSISSSSRNKVPRR